MTQIPLPFSDEYSGLHQLPSLPEHFTGREQELQILKQLGLAGGSGTIITISNVQGMGGIGKTALAIVAGYALRERFPDAQFFLKLNTYSLDEHMRSVEQVRDDVIRAFYPGAMLSNDSTALWNLYRTALSNKRCLLILDDVRDDEQVAPLLPPPSCAAILTSRKSLASGLPLRLDILSRAESIELLQLLCTRLTESEANDLADACGD